MGQNKSIYLIPVMLCFFCMGFVDLVGIASNYVKEDLGLTDSVANVFPSLVFFWFLIFSVPTGMLMNKIGRKKTVLLSLVVTVLALLLPLFGESFGIMLVAFSSVTWLRRSPSDSSSRLSPRSQRPISPCGAPRWSSLSSVSTGAYSSASSSLSAYCQRYCCL